MSMTERIPDGYEAVDDFAPTRRQVERVLCCSTAEVDRLIERGAFDSSAAGRDRVDLPSLLRYCGRTGLCEPDRVRASLAVPRDATTWRTSAIADLLGFSDDVVRRMIDRGELDAYRLPGGARLVSRDSLIDYLAANPGRQARTMGLRSTGHEPKPRRKVEPTKGRSR
jgi:excisionase family DNA binding protein